MDGYDILSMKVQPVYAQALFVLLQREKWSQKLEMLRMCDKAGTSKSTINKNSFNKYFRIILNVQFQRSNRNNYVDAALKSKIEDIWKKYINTIFHFLNQRKVKSKSNDEVFYKIWEMHTTTFFLLRYLSLAS